ncbi:8-oxo-dGTP diphosphatase [Fibrobacter sp. UWB12]|nr:8-oxo-dGTP diphosphatase [Fibrobacter sp. UWB12]
MLAVCGIVKKNGRILMCKRAAGVPFQGYWELPTEILEEDEPAENALERVFFERLTAKTRFLQRVGAVDFSYGEGYRILAYGVELEKNFIHIYGYDDFRWVKPCHLRTLRVLEPHVTLLTR